MERQWILQFFNELANTSIQNVFLRGLIQTVLAEGGQKYPSYHYFVQTSDLSRIEVRAHIETFPRQMSHYSRKDNAGREYLEEGWSVQRMYFNYLGQEEPAVMERNRQILRCQQENRRPGANAGFECKREAKGAAIESWKERSCVLGSASVKYRSKDAVDMITFDFEQNLPTPNLQHNDMFYKRQLWTFNFGIPGCVANQGQLSASLTVVADKTKTGVVALFAELHRRGIYEVLNHRFLIRGHTFLENNIDFSQIEKRKKS
ncbi:hypothetical protein ACROYT_G014335 [Oculina patagonica]